MVARGGIESPTRGFSGIVARQAGVAEGRSGYALVRLPPKLPRKRFSSQDVTRVSFGRQRKG
jgi:hypothetical protein